jgi:hypothetical protein
MDKIKAIKKSAVLLERILEHVHNDDYKSNVAVCIKSYDSVDVEALCKKMRVKKEIRDNIVKNSQEDWYWVNICESAVKEFTEKLLKKFSCCSREEVYQFGRSGGWISLALAEPFYDVCETVDYFLREENMMNVYAGLLGDEDMREETLSAIDEVYETTMNVDCEGMMQAIEYTEEAHRNFSFEKYIRADIRRKIREAKEYEERKAA